MDILKVENLTKIYGKGENSFKALDNVSFSVKRGQFVAIVGPSGSGKSTLLHLIGGVDRPDGGHVYVDSNDVYARNDTQLAIFRRREVGLIYQFYNLIPVLNVVENITLPVLMDGRKVDEERLEELLTVLHLKGRENHLPNQLSGGQQQGRRHIEPQPCGAREAQRHPDEAHQVGVHIKVLGHAAAHASQSAVIQPVQLFCLVHLKILPR